MITLEFRRFVADPTSLKRTSTSFNSLHFNVVFDHADRTSSYDCPIYRARKIASKWLKDHYGVVDIWVDDHNQELEPYHLKISNKRKFINDMLQESVFPIVHDPETKLHLKTETQLDVIEVNKYLI